MQSAFDPRGDNRSVLRIVIEERTQRSIEETNRRNNRNRKEVEYRVGDEVLRKNFTQGKLEQRWSGPFRIIQVIGANRLELDEGNRKTTHNIKNVRPCFPTPERSSMT